MDATNCLVPAELLLASTNKATSLYVIAPQFSIAPAAKSGKAMWSSFGRGKGIPKYSL